MEPLKEKYAYYLVLVISCVFSFSFLYYPGAYDVNYWMKWMNNLSRFGLLKGYVYNYDMYPPYASVFLYTLTKISSLLSITPLTSLKLGLFVCLVSSSLIILFWTKNIKIAIACQLIFTLISISLGYIDIVTAPFVLLSLYFLFRKKYLLFTFLFFINVMIKWQGIIMAPFLLVYLFNISSFKEFKNIEWKSLILKVAVPSIALIVITLAMFGSEVYHAFYRALNNDFLSDTINFNWIITRALYYFRPEIYKLSGGMMNSLRIQPGGIQYTISAVFWLLYLSILISFFKNKKDPVTLLKYSVAGYLAYFLFNTGIHENHLFLAALLSLVIIGFDQKFLGYAIALNLILNICLFFWFDVDGNQEYIYGRLATEISVLLALLFTLVFVLMYIPIIWHLKNETAIFFRNKNFKSLFKIKT